jgi:hypothetical protein
MFDIQERLVNPDMAETLVTHAYSTYARDRFVPERNYNLMPLEFRKQVCSCVRAGRLVRKDSMADLLSVCNKCNKPESYHLYRCGRCENLFIHDFRAPFCYKEPLCWDCTTDDPQPCSEHTYCEPYWSPEQYIAPVLPKPKVNTAEELANVFDFD